jgi:hypothetical protein
VIPFFFFFSPNPEKETSFAPATASILDNRAAITNRSLNETKFPARNRRLVSSKSQPSTPIRASQVYATPMGSVVGTIQINPSLKGLRVSLLKTSLHSPHFGGTERETREIHAKGRESISFSRSFASHPRVSRFPPI